MEKKRLENYIKYFNSHPHNDFALLIDGRIENSVLLCNLFSKIEFITNKDKYLMVFKLEELISNNLVIYGKERLNYHDLFEYINLFLGSNSYQLKVVVNKIEIIDYKNSFLEIKSIEFNNCEIDDKFIKIINLYFANLNRIIFINCKFNKNTNLNMLNCNLNFIDCEIELLSSLNYYRQKIDFCNTRIEQYNSTVVNCKDMVINFNELEIKKIMLYTNFPYLSNLEINCNDCLRESLNYISSACPNLENLKINGNVYSLDFIYKIKNINKCIINSVNDSIGTHKIITPEIENQDERNRIIKDTPVIVNSGLDERIVILEKIDQIVKSMKLLKYSLYEKDLYMKKENYEDIIIKKILNEKFKSHYVYDSNNYEMFLDNNNELFEYNVVGSNIYMYRKSKTITKYISYKENLINGIPFIYHANEIPIIFEKKPVIKKIVEEAKESSSFWNAAPEYYESFNGENDIYDDFEVDSIPFRGEECLIYFYDKNGIKIDLYEFESNEIPYIEISEDIKDKVEYASVYYNYPLEKILLPIINVFSGEVEVLDSEFVRVINSSKVFYGKHLIFNNNMDLCELINNVISIITEEINLKSFCYANISKKTNDLINFYNIKDDKKYIK